MPRQISRPAGDAGRMRAIAPINKGGTGASTPENAVVNLGGVSRLLIGQPNGLASADHRGFYPLSLLSDAGLEVGYSVHGPSYLAFGETYRFRLTNYNSTYPAEISVTAGEVYIDGDEIVLTAPESGESITLTVGERSFELSLHPFGASVPEILYPEAEARVSQQVTLVARPFRTIPENYTAWRELGLGEHEVAIPEDAIQLEIRGRKGTNGEAKVILDSRSFELPVSTSYRKIDIVLYGNVNFSVSGTGSLEYRWISNTSVHVGTDWQISEDPDFSTILQESLNDTINLMSWTVELEPGVYYVRTRFHSSPDGETLPPPTVPPATPSITSPSNGATIYNTGLTVTTSAFSSDNEGETHQSTDWEVSNNPNFTTIVVSEYASVSKTSWSVGSLSYGTTYYVRARHNGSTGEVSEWSAGVSFTPTLAVPNTPTVISAPNIHTDLPEETITITSSGFSSSNPNDVHHSTDWDFSWDNLDVFNSTSNKTSIQRTFNRFGPEGMITVRVRYRSSSGAVSAWSATKSFGISFYETT